MRGDRLVGAGESGVGEGMVTPGRSITLPPRN